MPTMCNGCGTTIFSIQYMECSNDKCRKMYDLKCIAIKPEDFERFTDDYKDSWMCPECSCLIPKGDNSDTPVRNSTMALNKTYVSAAFVNTKRGSRPQSQPSSPIPAQGQEGELLNELRGLRREILARLDDQDKQLKQFLALFSNTKNELLKVHNQMQMLEQKVLGASVSDPITADQQNEPLVISDNNSEKTYSAIISDKKKGRRRSNTITATQSVSCDTSAATKTADISLSQNIGKDAVAAQSYSVDSMNTSSGNEWKKVVNRKKKFMKGENTTSEIRATERKKHLHVWRLAVETTQSQVESHIMMECGSGINVQVQKIKHKVERDYASFIIGVPENKFDLINQPSLWPRGAEFSEWFWFRGSTYESNRK